MGEERVRLTALEDMKAAYARRVGELAEARESLAACLIERDGALADAADFLRERDALRVRAENLERAWADTVRERDEAREREGRLREALEKGMHGFYDWYTHADWREEFKNLADAGTQEGGE